MTKNGTLTTVTANDLRLAAEKADGFRGIPMALVPDEKRGVTVVTEEEAKSGDKEILVEILTPFEGGGVRGDAKVKLLHDNKLYPTPEKPDTPLASADAVFVTQSAVEKFVLPYYIR